MLHLCMLTYNIYLSPRFNFEEMHNYCNQTEINHSSGNKIKNSSMNGSVVSNDLFLVMHNFKKNSTEKVHFCTLDRKVVRYFKMIDLSVYFIYPTFKWKITQLVQGGLFDHWMESYKHQLMRSINERKSEEEYKIVITWNYLYVGFMVWLMVLLMSAMSILGERLRPHITKHFYARFLSC